MSYLDKVKAGASNSGGGNDSDSSYGPEGIEVDFDETSFVRQSPTTFVTGVAPEGEGNPVIRFKSPDYNEGRLDQGHLGLVLDDPEVVISEEEGTEGTVILETDDNDSTDYRLFNEDDDDTKVVEGMGVKFGDRLYEGEFVDEIDADRFILNVSGASSKNIAKRLDKKGAMSAGMDEETGDTNDGLIEYMPSDMREGGNEITSRYARDPELKNELYGQRLGLFLARREEVNTEDTGYGDDHEDQSEASYRELVEAGDARSMYWYALFDLDVGEEVEAEVTDQEVEGYTWLHEDWGQYNPSGGIPDDQWAFVEDYVEKAESGDVDTDEATITTNIEQNASNFDAAPETESMVAAIQNRV